MTRTKTVNRFPARCITCGTTRPPGHGVMVRDGADWRIDCGAGALTVAAPAPVTPAPVTPAPVTPAPAPPAPAPPALASEASEPVRSLAQLNERATRASASGGRGPLGYTLWLDAPSKGFDGAMFAASVGGHSCLDSDDIPGRRASGVLGDAMRSMARTAKLRAYFVRGEDRPTYALLRQAAVQETAPDGSIARVPTVTMSDEQVVRFEANGSLTFRTPVLEGDIRALVASHGQLLPPHKLADFARAALYRVRAAKLADGLYFVPASRRDIVDALAAVAASVGGRLGILTIADDVASEATTRTSVADDIARELAGMRAQLADYHAIKSAGERTMRGSTLDARVQEYRALREKADAYATLVQLDASALLVQLDAVESEMSALF